MNEYNAIYYVGAPDVGYRTTTLYAADIPEVIEELEYRGILENTIYIEDSEKRRIYGNTGKELTDIEIISL